MWQQFGDIGEEEVPALPERVCNSQLVVCAALARFQPTTACTSLNTTCTSQEVLTTLWVERCSVSVSLLVGGWAPAIAGVTNPSLNLEPTACISRAGNFFVWGYSISRSYHPFPGDAFKTFTAEVARISQFRHRQSPSSPLCGGETCCFCFLSVLQYVVFPRAVSP